MKKIVGCSQMKSIDAMTIHEMGVPSCVLMERAALAVVEEIESRHKKGKILVVCGSGNNGGDGIAIARILKLHGFHADVYLAGKTEKMTQETVLQYKIAQNYHVSFVNNIQWNEYTTIVDSIFGVGLARNIEGSYRDLIMKMNDAEGLKVAVDIPSGIHGDTGAVLGAAFQADVTVTFAYTKYGLCLYPGRMYAGQVKVADIGIYMQNEAQMTSAASYLECCDLNDLPERVPYGNKGTFGKVLVVGGSNGMCGAAYLSASAVLAGGAGMVKIFTAEENRILLQASLPEAMISCTFTEEECMKSLKWCDVLIIGPGIGVSDDAASHVEWFLKHSKKADKTVVLDADGLNLLAVNPEWAGNLPEKLIITPHLGEVSRLTGLAISDIKKNPIEMAYNLAKRLHCVCVMKDACTVVADAKGNIHLNMFGNAGMATAGSGDVLSGIIASICCMYLNKRDVELEYQAAMGVMLHGLGGDKAAELKNMYSMTARDIVHGVELVLGEKED